MVLDHAAFVRVECFEGVISPLDIDLRQGQSEKAVGPRLGEHANGVHTLEGGQDQRPIGSGIKRAKVAFQGAHAVVAVHAHQEKIAQVPGGFQIGHMSGMQEVETAISDDQLPAFGSAFGPPNGQGVKGKNFFGAPQHERQGGASGPIWQSRTAREMALHAPDESG